MHCCVSSLLTKSYKWENEYFLFKKLLIRDQSLIKSTPIIATLTPQKKFYKIYLIFFCHTSTRNEATVKQILKGRACRGLKFV